MEYNLSLIHILGDIEEGCRKRGIKVTKNRSSMEGKLIEALTEEYMK